MPRGSRHDETGWLNEDGGEFVLRRDEGGRWRLEFGLLGWWRARKLVGCRVRVQGIREDFDVLGVKALSRL